VGAEEFYPSALGEVLNALSYSEIPPSRPHWGGEERNTQGEGGNVS